jgi:antirestriction protein ArdC
MKAGYIRKTCQQAFHKLIDAVAAGKSEKLVEYLKAMAKFHRYSLGNTILINFQKPDATHVAGFWTWKKLGRYVKKGEKGIAIMAPIIAKRTIEQYDKEQEEETLLAFKPAYVFDISQTEGKQLPEHSIVKGYPAQYMERLKAHIRNKGIELDYSDRTGLAEGYSTGGRIILRKSLEGAQEFSVMVHEFAHEMLHKDRTSLSQDKKVVETEAEAVAFVVCHAIGLDVNTASSDYIQLYDGDRNTLMSSLERIQRTASGILNAIMENKERRNVAVEEQNCIAQAA